MEGNCGIKKKAEEIRKQTAKEILEKLHTDYELYIDDSIIIELAEIYGVKLEWKK